MCQNFETSKYQKVAVCDKSPENTNKGNFDQLTSHDASPAQLLHGIKTHSVSTFPIVNIVRTYFNRPLPIV